MDRKEKIKPERLFLAISLIAGLAFALLQPLFIEPDSSYHFDKAMYISNTVVDRTKVGLSGEDYQSSPIPFTTVSSMMQKGVYFEKFFETKLPVISKEKVVDKRVKGTKWYKDIMHLVPSFGVKLGHAIFPSIGVMVITARLLVLLFFSISMYFIIRYLKAYRMLFVIISVTPVVIQFSTSLSYDSFNYVAFAWLSATLINIAVDIKEKKERLIFNTIIRLLLPCITVYFSKTNSYLLYSLAILILIILVGNKLKISLTRFQVGLIISLSSFFAVLIYIWRYQETIFTILGKFIYTLMEPYYTVFTTEVISGTSTAGVPAWFYPIQYSIIILLLLSYTEERVPRWFAHGCFGVSIVNLLAILFTFSANPSFADLVITGPQGRYFTPFLLISSPFFTIFTKKIKVKYSGIFFKKAVVFTSIMALMLNLGLTIIKFYQIQSPMDEYRSGVEHYIFK